MCNVRNNRLCLTGALILVLFGFAGFQARADVLSDNLESLTTASETASPTRWLTGAFATDSAEHDLSSVTLLLAYTLAGSAELDLYTDGGLEPGALVATLEPPGSFSSTLSESTFTADGVALDPDSTYWLVLRVTSGQFEWGWTSSHAGTGAGFLHTWGVSEDAGDSWWSYDIYQTQFSVTVDAPCTLVGDVNDDQQVGLADLTTLLAHFGVTGGATLADGDLDGDTDVDLTDLATMLANFGSTCP